MESNRLVQHTDFRQKQDEDEISLVDIIRFFSSNSKFLLLTTAGLSVSTVSLSLLTPQQYQKQLSLSVNSVPLQLSQPLPVLDAAQIGSYAVELLKDRPPKGRAEAEEMSIKSNYNTATQRLDVILRSPNPSFLKTAAPKEVVRHLKLGFQERLDETIQVSIASIELQIKRTQQTLTQLEQQITQLSITNLNSQGLRTVARLEAVETRRVDYITTIATLKFDKAYLEQVQKNPAEFVSQFILVQISTESDVQPTRSLVKLVMLAVIASFIMAVLATVIRDQLTRLADELSRQKPKPSEDL